MEAAKADITATNAELTAAICRGRRVRAGVRPRVS
jgi:hypothetical protein